MADVVFVDTPVKERFLGIVKPCERGLFIFLADDNNCTVCMYHEGIDAAPLTWVLIPDSRYSISYTCDSMEALIGRVNKFRM